MLQKQMKKYITDVLESIESQQGLHKLKLFKEEKDYAEKHKLIPADIMKNITLVEEDALSRFTDAIIERCNKETEELIAKEGPDFLHHPITILNKKKDEFVYMESKWFHIIDADAISIEADDVFEIYSVMLGLKVQKKYHDLIKSYFENNLQGQEVKFNILFNHDDGLWNVNFALDYIDGFKEDFSIGEAYGLLYQFLFTLVDTIEEVK
ncbi:branched-chain amino acid aminotransferase [Bacillus sp. FSL K6-3431]|uniref:branched-chain amino acid aminotransferase n=1 Tax=Bacillus sp. FSL K6-3431 TaxID=2921500 RepID=UPI0030F7F813